ncbi:allatostatin-A receptor-like [Stylophora pistillata]|uniref:Allatostatin-A receptor n=1 Tax=Stylophora pistillata TaxID=50429 RepID=A0A2B4SNF9_STYPI|nr:allatostatin-A receptor-like [Stylophora pistillata]PFX30603.1 Allatostatin-A receptor [Stylophora pistillata]
MAVSLGVSNIVLKTVCLILVLISLVGNTLVILTVLLNKAMQTTLNYLLVNLAVADMMFALSTGLKKGLFPYLTHPEGNAGRWSCAWVTHGDLAWFGAAASILFLVYIAVERYFAIIHQLRHRGRFTRGRLKLVIGIPWFVSIVINTAEFWEIRYYYFDSGLCKRYGNKSTTEEKFIKAYSLIWMLLAGAIPPCIMTAFLRHRKQVTVTLLMVGAIYAFCWIPSQISFVTENWGLPVPWFNVAGHVLVVLNSCVNPVVYSFRLKSFRQHLRNIMQCKKRRQIRALPGLTMPGTANVVHKTSAAEQTIVELAHLNHTSM